nr:ribonuclease H-like domain-containing protein [Tanacetum cinerariifolium]
MAGDDTIITNSTSISPLPKSPFLALQNPHWNNDIHDEYNALVKNGTWILVPRPAVQWSSQPPSAQSLVLHSLASDPFINLTLRILFLMGIYLKLHLMLGFSNLWVLPPVLDFTTAFVTLLYSFFVRDLRALNYFLGISATRRSTRQFLSQKHSTDFLYMHDPREPYLATLKRILCYIRGTLDFGFHLYSSTTISLVGYIDTDSAGCPSTRQSTLGYCIFLGDNLLSWSSKRQQTISCSSAKAEYRGVANVVAETAWLRNLFRELHSPLSAATLVYCDNVSAAYLSANPVQHQRTKHIEIDIHFVCDLVTVGQVRVLHVPSRYQYANIFTKGLPSALFEDFRSSLSIHLPPAQTAGAY